jgi:hypothetical protein
MKVVYFTIFVEDGCLTSAIKHCYDLFSDALFRAEILKKVKEE